MRKARKPPKARRDLRRRALPSRLRSTKPAVDPRPPRRASRAPLTRRADRPAIAAVAARAGSVNPAQTRGRDAPLAIESRGRPDAVGRLGTECPSPCWRARGPSRRAGRDVIHLGIGEPDFETPEHVAEAGIEAIRAGETHYCQTAGLPELREAAARSLSRSRGIPVEPECVLVANGAKPFLFFTVLATAGRGTRWSIRIRASRSTSRPIRLAGATPVPLPLREERGFSFDPNELEQLLSDRAYALVILNAPQNPTGGVIPQADVRRRPQAILATPAWVLTRRGLLANHLRRRRALDRDRCPGCSTARCCSTASRRRSQ